MWAASEIAEWWDKQHAESKRALDTFVDNNPNLFGVVVAGTLATAMDLGHGMVDVLRLGEGAAEGGWKGYAKDALRVISIAGTLGRGAKMIQSARGIRLAKVIVDPGGPRCGYVSATQALKQTAQKAYAAVDDLAKELNVPPEKLAGSSLASRVQQMLSIGAKVKPARTVSTIEEVVTSTPRDGSVTLMSVVGKRSNGEVIGHAVYGFRDVLGRFRIMDRGGSGATGQVFESLEELAARYKVPSFTPRAMAVLENVFLKFVGPKGTATLAIELLAAAATDPETVAQSFEVMKAASAGRQRIGQQLGAKPAIRNHTVVHGDWLSKLSQKYYGNPYKWPVIYNANLDVIGSDPNLIKPGQILWIPELPKVKGVTARS